MESGQAEPGIVAAPGLGTGVLHPGQPCPTEPLVPPDKRSLLAKELLSLSPSQRSHMLLSLPLCLAEKRALW